MNRAAIADWMTIVTALGTLFVFASDYLRTRLPGDSVAVKISVLMFEVLNQKHVAGAYAPCYGRLFAAA